MSDFEVLNLIGTGGCGTVYLVKKLRGQDCDKLYAMKILEKSYIFKKVKRLRYAKAEREVLEAIREFPFLVTLYYAFQSESKLHLVLDYVAGGDLCMHLGEYIELAEDEVRTIIGEVILALEPLHRLGMVYRDIKLKNILIDSSGHIVLTDFGLCKKLLREKRYRTNSRCGTAEYMPPEIVNRTTHDFSADWWSLGVLTYKLLTSKFPFGERAFDGKELYVRINYHSPKFPRHLSADVKDFMRQLLNKNPSERLGQNGSEEVKGHKFLEPLNFKDLAEKKVKPPLVPEITSGSDARNFSSEFTSKIPAHSSEDLTQNNEESFEYYYFEAPSNMPNENVNKEDVFECSNDNKIAA